MKQVIKIVLVLFVLINWSCSKDNNEVTPTVTPTTPNTPTVGNDDWLIPQNEVRDGGPGKDGIPSVDNPSFSSIDQIDFLEEQDLVIIVETGEDIKAYPHPILDWHEIVNDDIIEMVNGELVANSSLSLTYCPLTGTAIGWDGNVAGTKTSFGVSGLLYNSNLMPYDRATDSFWSQMEHKCVKGALVGTEINTFHVLEMSFSTLKETYPDAQVMNTSTGFNRDYQRYPYGDYRTNNNSIIFPVSNTDARVPSKERVLGVVVGEEVLTYRFSSFSNQTVNVVQNRFNGKDLVVFGSRSKNFLTAYENKLADGTVLNFEAVENALPIVAQDNEGNQWDIFGKAVAGPRTGEALPAVLNYIGYWFSWATFNVGLEIYEE